MSLGAGEAVKPATVTAPTGAVSEFSNAGAIAGAQPAVMGEAGLRRVDAVLSWLSRLPSRVLPDSQNPMLQPGAIANTNLVIAVVTGIVLLIWYRPSVLGAYSSVSDMAASPLSAGLLRSLHRYSSDACLLFGAWHGLQMFVGRRVGGPRWVAWITGILAVSTLWLVGWLGYWLVWDERARQVALGSARVLDALPVLVDPIGRSLLTEASINSLLFFIVFFAHMLLPLIIGIALWLHIVRVSRAKLFTDRTMTAWVSVALIVMSLIWPAASAAPAQLQVHPATFTMDWWYLAPLALTDRLTSGALWGLMLVGALALYSLPWWIVVRRRKGPAAAAQANPGDASRVEPSRCNACRRCSQDCPYEAISMVPRTYGADHDAVAFVDPSRCVGCGICVASCNSVAMNLPWLPMVQTRKGLEDALEANLARGGPGLVAILCVEAVGDALRLSPTSNSRVMSSPDLPGFEVLSVPCAGWIHMSIIERLLRRGVKGILVVGCHEGACSYREGAEWTEQRLMGEREPSVRADKVDTERVRWLRSNYTEKSQIVRAARELATQGSQANRSHSGNDTGHATAKPARATAKLLGAAKKIAGGVAVAALTASVLYLPSDFLYRVPPRLAPELVVSFKLAGELAGRQGGRAGLSCRALSAEELAALPLHMRRSEVCERNRIAVRLRIAVDGESLVDRAYEPEGLFSDGASLAIERLTVTPGEHLVQVDIGDTASPAAPDGTSAAATAPWAHSDSQTLTFETGATRVVLFDKVGGFAWY